MKIQFVPRWPGSINGRAVNLCRQFYSSLAAHYEMEDLLQEAYIVFMRCKGRFQIGGGPALFMAFFSVALANKLRSMITCCPRYIFIDDADQIQPAEPVQDDLAFLLCVLREVPSEITDLLCALSDGLPKDLQADIERRIKRAVERGFLMRKMVPTATREESLVPDAA